MRVTFQNDKPTPFFIDLSKQVNEYFKSQANGRKATSMYWVKIASFFLLYAGFYFTVLYGTQNPLIYFFCYLGMGFLAVSILFAVGHDSVHNAVSSNPKVNYAMGYVWNFFGISSYFWRLKHNVSHHAFTNIPGSDGDLDQTKLLRLNPMAPRLSMHKYQHIYAMILYSILGPYILVIRDFKLLGEKKFGNRVLDRHPISEVIIIILSKVWFLWFMIWVPATVTGMGVLAAIGWAFVMFFMAGIFTAVVSFPVHVTYESDFALPNDNGMVEMDFMTHQMLTTVDYSAENKLIHWFFGGINTHVVHHMFPSVNHMHYYNLTKMVKATAKKHNLRYINKSFDTVMIDHLMFLKELGTHDNPTNLNFIDHDSYAAAAAN